MTSTPTFTAVEIARALGAKRQAVQRWLASITPAGVRIVRGNEANAWTVGSLPERIRAKLKRRATASGCRSMEHLLGAPSPRFESPLPVDQLAPQIQERMRKTRAALARPLIEQANGMTGAALDALGLGEYERVFGFAISARRWRDILMRTIDRDAGEEQWDRLDLYIDDRPHVPRATKQSRVAPAQLEAEKILLGYAAGVRAANRPTIEEKALLWNVAFEQTIELVESGIAHAAARRAVRKALWKCGVTLAKNETSLAQLWRTKEAAWREADGQIAALKDQRGESSGNHRAPEIPQSDLDLVIGYAVKFEGRISQAWRHVLENRLLSAPVQSHYEGISPASKSYVPRLIRDAVTADTRRLASIHHGPRKAKLDGAYITRDWTNTAAGDWHQADDVTLNRYYFAPDDRSGFTLMRGQVLLMIDVRSTCILSFAMLDQRNYTSHSIRTLITRTCDAHGLPRRGWYFERGLWESSRLLKGDRNVSDDELTWTESEGGLRELGLTFRHSKLPRSKPVERVIGQIQNLLDGSPGDAGRDEMKKPFERLLEQKRLVESGREHPSRFFLSWEQAEEQLARVCEEYNNARNDGQMTRGLTPFMAWQRFQTTPLAHLSGEARYLLACHKRPVKVTRNGIRLQFGKKAFIYHDKNTGRLEGQRVLAWFNPELPEMLSVTDLDRKNCFTVAASEAIDAMDASPDVLEGELARVAAHNDYARQRYRTIARVSGLNPRPTYMDRDTAELGREIGTQQKELQAQRKDQVRRARMGHAVLGELGLRPRRGEDLTDEQVEAAKRVLQAQREFEQENSQ